MEIIKYRMKYLIKRNKKYIKILEAIVGWEKANPEKVETNIGWQMEDIPLTLEYWNGGFLNQLLKSGIIKKGYYSRHYHQYMLAKSPNVIKKILDEVKKEL